MDQPFKEAWKENLRSYVLEHGDDLTFTKHFWKGCEPLSQDINQYEKFARAHKLLGEHVKASRVADVLGVNHNSVHNWKHLQQMPKLGHFLKALLSLGPPTAGRVWLTIEQSHGYAIPLGQFIQIPDSIQSWEDVNLVLPQIAPISEEATEFSRPYLFGFLVGVILGDTHKPKQGHSHRHIDLVLSKKYETNVRIGDFTSYCANQFGLRMSRSIDRPKPVEKPHGFYEWISQSSPLIDWIFNVILGLKDGQTTTYDTVNLDWALNAPLDFRVGLIQGISESDGSVSIASQIVEFWVIPDWDFMIKLLATFGLRGFRNREAVSLVKSQAIKSFGVPVFSEHLQTVRYQRLKLMATTRTLSKLERVPLEVRLQVQRLAKEGLSTPRIVEEVARTSKLLISFEAAQSWSRKSQRESSEPGEAITKEYD
ncbi:MAG: hypothetical protein OK441_01635 [Thaumarchaeota archaeon]|nr:hypothetical protein [Nitrososphaerota archaeon]